MSYVNYISIKKDRGGGNREKSEENEWTIMKVKCIKKGQSRDVMRTVKT